MTRLWQWLSGLGVIAAIGGVVALLLGRRSEQRQAADRAAARNQLDDAVELGLAHQREVDDAEDEREKQGMREHPTAGDYLRKQYGRTRN